MKSLLEVRRRTSLLILHMSVLASLMSACGGSGSTSSGAGTGAPQPNTSNEWTWMRGAEADDQVPSNWTNPWSEPYNSDPYYGTLGTPGAHTVPGGRNSSAYWTDPEGNFWLFGGDGLDGSPAPIEGLLNDLWKFSPATNEWTWVGGSSTLPSAFSSCGLGPGYCGLPGVYGTQGTASPLNIPGGRKLAVTWTDNAGNFWLYGGYGIDSIGNLGFLNDLWEFNPTTQQWAWISGSSANPGGGSPGGNYGTQGVAAPENVPPGLIEATGWIDKNDNLWLFGGSGIASPDGGQGYDFNNLWEFNPTTKQWTWISGNGGGEDPDYGVYGTLGTPAPGNIPSGRNGATSWMDSSGNMWLFGGYGVYPAAEGGGVALENALNDLWEFNPATRQWTWMAGTAGGVPNLVFSYGGPSPPPGIYGTRGIASASNSPGGRSGANGWIDNSGNLWLFGGNGEDSTDNFGPLDDLWKFDPASKQWTWISGDSLAWSSAVYGAQGTPAVANVPGSRYNSATWIGRNGSLWLFAGWGVTEDPIGGSTVLNDLWRFQP